MAKPIPVAEAERRVLAEVRAPLAVEEVALDDALGRRLARDYRCPTPWPVTDRSAMDGFAVTAGAAGLEPGSRLPVAGESLAGHPFDGAVPDGAAIRIMTGAVVPDGVDAVVPVEATSGYEGDTVTLQAAVRAGDHIRRRGSEVAEGERLLAAGRLLRSAEIGALAVLGVTSVPAFRRPVVAILSTGDEVVPAGAEPAPHQVRDSNSHALGAQVVEAGGEPLRLGIGGDDRKALTELLGRGLEQADVLLTIGGVSKGTHDLVHGCLRELGVREVLHGIALKPGKPTFFGVRGDGPPFVFGLPGNPASCYTVFDLLVRPLLDRLGGAQAPPRLELPVAGAPFKRNWRLQAVPARLARGAGGACAELERPRPSGDPFGLLEADGYALIEGDVEPGATGAVAFLPYGAARR